MPDSTGQNEPLPSPRRLWPKRIGTIIGLLLFAGAIYAVWRQHESVGEALRAIRDPSWLHVALLLGCVAANLVLTSFVYNALYARYGRVGLMEMQAVITSATLLNFLPMRPGMFGRVAYHKRVNGIRVRDSVKVIGQSIAISGGASAYLLFAAWVISRNQELMWPLLCAPVVGFALLMLWPRRRMMACACGCRYVDLMLWAVRYYAAFALLGLSIPAPAALAFAAISATAMLVPFVSNGLGVREWAIGLLAPVLASHQLELGITAELVNRAGEVVVIGLTGCIGLSMVAARLRSTSRAP